MNTDAVLLALRMELAGIDGLLEYWTGSEVNNSSRYYHEILLITEAKQYALQVDDRGLPGVHQRMLLDLEEI